jgi:hypothetical protein
VIHRLLLLLPDRFFFAILLKSPDLLVAFGLFVTENVPDSGDFEKHNRQLILPFLLHSQDSGLMGDPMFSCSWLREDARDGRTNTPMQETQQELRFVA